MIVHMPGGSTAIGSLRGLEQPLLDRVDRILAHHPWALEITLDDEDGDRPTPGSTYNRDNLRRLLSIPTRSSGNTAIGTAALAINRGSNNTMHAESASAESQLEPWPRTRRSPKK